VCYSCVDPKCNDESVKKSGIGDGQYCNICGLHVAIGVSNSPSSLKQHVLRCNREVHDQVASAIEKATNPGRGIQPQSPLHKFMTKKMFSHEVRQKCLRATTVAVVALNWAYSTVTNTHFRGMQQAFANAGSKAPKKGFGVDSLQSDINLLKHQMLEKLKKQMAGNVIHGMTDHWTSHDWTCF